MKEYNHEKINELIQPLMEMLKTEFPNNCKLIIEPNYAKIVYEHTEMNFLDNETVDLMYKGKKASKSDLLDFAPLFVAFGLHNEKE